MTRATIVENRDAAKAAWLKSLTAQSYTVNMGGTSRSLTNQNSKELYEVYQEWENRLDRYDRSTRRIKFGTARI